MVLQQNFRQLWLFRSFIPGALDFASLENERNKSFIFSTVLIVFVFFAGGCSSFQQRIDTNPSFRQEIVAVALQYEGAPYKWSGNTSDGFDCAGYVQFVFKQAGFDVPRVSRQQFGSGYKVARSNLRKGDLVFFTKWRFLNLLLPPNHVGIYIGRNRFIHAPSSGKTVRIDDLDNPYWRAHYKGARNLLYNDYRLSH